MPQSGHGGRVTRAPPRRPASGSSIVGPGVRDFSLDAARILSRAVPFDGVCVLTMDPATLLPTGEVVENGLPPAVMARMTEIELRGDGLQQVRRARPFGPARGEPQRGDRGAISTAACAIESSGDRTGSATSCEPCWSAMPPRGERLRCCAPPTAATSRRPTPPSSRQSPAISPRDCAARCCSARCPASARTTRTPPGFLLLAADNSVTLADAAARDLARRAGRRQSRRAAPAGGRCRGPPSAQHRGRGRRTGRRRPGARADGIRALAPRTRVDARRAGARRPP